MAANSECVVCYLEAEGEIFSCKCGAVVCSECSITYFRYTEEERAIPCCTGCRKTIYHSEVKGDLLDAYLSCVKKHFLTNQSSEVKESLAITDMVSRIRQEKYMFMRENVPKAIALTARLCMDKKMVGVRKGIVEAEKKRQTLLTVPCMNMSCRGKLGDDYVCSMCDTPFCKECETKKLEGHVCKEEDLQTVKETRGGTKCPNCGIPFFRYSGCDHMTCAACKTHFNHATGEISAFGNPHNKEVELKTDRKLHDIYGDELGKKGLFMLVKDIETAAPKPYNPERINKLIIKVTNGKDDRETLLKLAKEYKESAIVGKKYKNYSRAVVEIENLIRSDTLTREALNTIRSRL